MEVDRRKFIAMMTLGSASALITASSGQNQQAWAKIPFLPQFSGEITRLALIGDATALALQDQTLPVLLRRALTGTSGLSSILGMGMMFPPGDSVISFLAAARRNWLDSGTEDDQHRLAIATGYLMHRAAEHRIRQGLEAAGIKTAKQNVAKLQQDAEVIRSLLTNSPQIMAEIEALLFVLDQRLRIKLHTLKPDETDQTAWVLKLLEWDAAQEILFKQLAAAIAEPNASERFLYVEALNFFDSTSPLVTAARGQKAVELVADKTGETSLYGRALADCRRVVTLVGQFINGSISAEALAQKLC